MSDGTIVSENGTALRPDGTVITLNKTAVLLNETSVEKVVIDVAVPGAHAADPERPTISKGPPVRDAAGTKTQVKPSPSREDQASTRPGSQSADDRDVSQQERCLESSSAES